MIVRTQNNHSCRKMYRSEVTNMEHNRNTKFKAIERIRTGEHQNEKQIYHEYNRKVKTAIDNA